MVEFVRTNRDRILTTAWLMLLAVIGVGASILLGMAIVNEAGITSIPLDQPVGDRSLLVWDLVGHLVMLLLPILIVAFIGAEVWGVWDPRVGKRRMAFLGREKRKASHRRKVAHEGAP